MSLRFQQGPDYNRDIPTRPEQSFQKKDLAPVPGALVPSPARALACGAVASGALSGKDKGSANSSR